MRMTDQNPRAAAKGRPWQSRSEFLVDQALAAWSTDEEALRHLAPPGLPPRPLFPDRTGMYKVEPGIMDVLNIDRYLPGNKSWVSGFPVEYRQGERVYSTGEQSGQAGSRNSMSPGWT